ncbi:MAG: OmpA family protein [Lewinellaceae bacterium]|nr:OmpA family protein [Saprospiraceae bacterium]MCB9336936.1 OmpA family protein [Lewinellaceae bacterium]
MAKRINITILPYLVVFILPLTLPAQNAPTVDAVPPLPQPYKATPAHMWEIGLHAGSAFTFGDVDFVPNWGAGFHIRRAIDYVFSLRLDGLYAELKNDDQDDGNTQATFQSGTLQLLISVNNLLWTPNTNRKVNLYAIIGGGLNRFKLDVLKTGINNPPPVAMGYVVQTHGDMGAGIAFRIAPRFNLGFESKASVLFGKDGDRLDGVDRKRTDVLSYSSVRLNFNLGNKDKKAEPLYWVNPMDVLMKDVTELKNRPVFDLTDTDGDGVIDLLDQDNNTPPGAEVDTRGMALDSDGDGIPNFEDDEPYVKKGRKIAVQEEGKPFMTEDDVKKVFDDQISGYTSPGKKGGDNGGSTSGGAYFGQGGIADWFLPIIHFNIDSYKIRYADYGSLANIANVMKSNRDLKVVVTGFTDKTASDAYNLNLSYNRANAAINHLVNIHGIARSRLILNYSGENEPLVPSTGSTLMNRRVEFKVAHGDEVDMDSPKPITGKNKGKGY